MADLNNLLVGRSIVNVPEGKNAYYDLINLSFQYYAAQRELLSSVFNEQNQSTHYAVQLRARALELSRIRLFLLNVFNDINLESSRSEFIYRTFGSFLEIDTPFIPEGSDVTYRNYVDALLAVVLKGSKKPSIEEGLDIFTQGLPFDVVQVYLDCVAKSQAARNLSGFVVTDQGSVPYRPSAVCDKSDTNLFYVRFKLDERPPGVDLNYIANSVDFFLDILKPAHTAYFVKWDLEDDFQITPPDCVINYDLILDENVPEIITLDLSGLEIISKEDNVLTLSDNTKLFVLDSTVIEDETNQSILYADLNVGDFISHVSSPSPGRYQYSNSIDAIPPELLFTSVGYLHAPLITQVDSSFTSTSLFQMFVTKQLDSQRQLEVVTNSSGVCDIKKDRLYTWYYDDFRKCGAQTESQVFNENVTMTYDPADQCVQVKKFPMTDGTATGSLATVSHVSVTVDGNPVVVSNVHPLTGKVFLQDPVSIPVTSIEVTYNWSENVSYVLNHNEFGNVMNKIEGTGLGDFASLYNETIDANQKKTNWKIKAFSLTGSSLLNLNYSLRHNVDAQYESKMNHARVVTNYTDKPCKIYDKVKPLGLTLEGDCLPYPTPPVQLRYSVEANLPDPWKMLETSDILNDYEELLNSPNITVLNNILRRVIYGPYDKRYAFTDIEKSDCGGDRTFYPFCDSAGFSFTVGFEDTKEFIVPEIDHLLFNDEGMLENQNPFYGIEYTGTIFEVKVRHEETIPIFDEELTTNVNINNILYDTYKNTPLNYLIDNQVQTTTVPGAPIYGFDPNSDVINGLNMLNNEELDLLNNPGIIQTGNESDTENIDIPPSHVLPGDSLDVLPPDLKNDPSDTNYVFHGKQTFDESVLWSMNALLDDVYLFPTERYVLNQTQYGLNTPGFNFNPADEILTLN